jgi:hypothetical protein
LNWGNLYRCDLSRCDLSNTKIEFILLPSIRTLSSINLGALSGPLALELLRRDAASHPRPGDFSVWAADGAPCPYLDEERFWLFDVEAARQYWSPGPPQMTDVELIVAICKEKGWGICNYLPCPKED